MKPIFNKNKYLQIQMYNTDKTKSIYYIKPKDNIIIVANKTYLIDSNHVFFNGKFKSIVVTSNSAQTINPLDFQSKFNASEFNSAINNNLIKETFATLNDNKIDWIKVIMFANLLISAILLYLLLKQQGVL